MIQNKGNLSSVEADGENNTEGHWLYSDEVKRHFFSPLNFVTDVDEVKDFDGLGLVGSPACGDMMKVWIKVDDKEDKIKQMKWQTFGCASAIGSTSALSEMVTENNGMDLEKAMQIKPQDIIARLGGLPNKKIHCSVLGDKALRSAINDYFKRSGQVERIREEGARMIDSEAKVTDKDIEEAVLEGATTLEAVQKKTKAGLGRPELIPEIEELIKFYREKYFG
ncbi:MAG TPA: iron-sulfur cluster assembly scaffold protein [Candidatus Moranbacteria bacterium]|nr:iron-sulfur cluster assembly scaffold protein [Candidatus Moranbacteria bacterium]